MTSLALLLELDADRIVSIVAGVLCGVLLVFLWKRYSKGRNG